MSAQSYGGLEAPVETLGLVFNAPSKHLVAHVLTRASADFPGYRRLFHRHVTSPLYCPVFVEDDALEFDEPMSSSDRPYVYFLVRRATSPARNAFNWSSISRIVLPSGNLEPITAKLAVPEEYETGWVSRLLYVHPDALSVTATIGLLPKPESGGKVRYFVAEVEGGSGRTTILAPLRHPSL